MLLPTEDAELVAIGVRSDHLDDDADGGDLALLGAGLRGKGRTDGARRWRADAPAGRAGRVGRPRAAVLRRVGAAIVKEPREAAVVASVLDHVTEQRPASAEALPRASRSGPTGTARTRTPRVT